MSDELSDSTASSLSMLARYARIYYLELIELGFDEEQAMELVVEWQTSCLG